MPLPTYTTTCTYNKCITHDVYECRFTKPEGFKFRAGQYIMFLTPLVSDPSDCQARAYSIASTPAEEELLFIIKLVEKGRMSCFVEEKLKEGTEIEMQGPLGVFTLKPDDTRDLLFVCTATGNAPFRSIIKEELEAGDKRKMDLIYGVRHEEDLFWVDEFEKMAKAHPNFSFHVILSKPKGEWSGHTGHVQDIIQSAVPDVAKRSVYICGNPAMTKEVKKLCIEEFRMEKSQVKVEEYI